MALLAAGGSILKRVFLPRDLQPDQIATFHAFLDTLIPGGAERTGFPGALATTIGPRLLSEATNRRARRALVEGIERRGPGIVLDVAEPNQGRVLIWAE